LNERHFNEAAEVQRGFLKPCKDASGFFQPPNETLDDVALPVCSAVEFHRTLVAVFIFLGRNHRLDAQSEQVLVNPIGTVSFVATKPHGPSHGLAVTVAQLGVRSFQQRIESRRVVRLPRGQMKMERMTVTIAKKVDFCGKTPARTA
jgi:hypothetical protein